MRNKVIKILTISAVVGVGWLAARQTQAACQATVEVLPRGVNGVALTRNKFAIFEQTVSANETPAPGKQLFSGSTDAASGVGKATVNLTEGVSAYAVRVTNPSADGFDFWFFNQLTLACSDAATVDLSLSAIKLKITDSQNLLQEKIKYSLMLQTRDANDAPLAGKLITSGDTGTAGEKIIYLPPIGRTYGQNFDYYYLEMKNARGVAFVRPNVFVPDGVLTEVVYPFSDLIIRAKDTASGNWLPNTKLNIYERLPGTYGGYETGKQLAALNTDNNGRAYWQYPAGTYIVQFTKPSGQKVNFDNIVIEDKKRTQQDLLIEDYNQGKCSVKSGLKLTFRDFDSKLVGNLSFNIYEQKFNADGQPVADVKITSGRVDANGLSKIDFYPQPAKRYLLEVCDKSPKYGCFWFSDLAFDCQTNLTQELHLKSVDVILRSPQGKLLTGQKFKIYLQQKNVDSAAVVSKDQPVGTFTIPASGRFRLYLNNRKINGEPLAYFLAVDKARAEIVAPWEVSDDVKTILEYVVGNQLTPYRQGGVTASGSPSNNLRGRILLQVESRGEAWYVNPVNGRRYFLGRAEDAFQVMKSLSVGASNAQLAKIKPNVEIVSTTDIDSDGDGLADVLEKGLGTNWQIKDSDADGYDDNQEVKNGYSPNGVGRLTINNNFARSQAGKILLQVEGRGEAWYVSPVNNERYYLSRPADAFAIMRALGLGITNADLNKIAIGQ